MSESEKGAEGRSRVEVLTERLKERIYAGLTMIAVLLGLTMTDHATTLTSAGAVLGTAAGLWLATIVADQQAHRVVHGRLARGRELRHMLYVTSPLLTVAGPPLLMLLLTALGALDLDQALYVSVGVGTAGLFTWGVLAGLRMGGGWVAALTAGFADLLIGGVVVGVKLLAGH